MADPASSSDRQPVPPAGWWMRGVGAVVLTGVLFTSSASAFQAKAKQKPAASADAKDAAKKSKPEKTAYDYVLPGADGKDVPLTTFKGKYILVVNLARKSSYNAQLAALEKDYETYRDKGVVVIGVPSNDFGAAEPGKDAEIQKAYTDAKVTFPVMAVSKLAGDDVIPFYLYLTKSKDAPAGGPVHWNYTKFIVNKEGKVIARLGPDVTPDSPEMISTIDQILDGRYKPKKGGKDGPPGPGGDDDDE
ncbi:glutathione peroxidase [Granulicella aggregans]|uniref:Glutathione peroxidase n=1 Tax=Granulicella aggregans TaxID=474949 RepID=A0A7W8E2L6_9BACT|nr:glutathione peroxidase [Granulicella aggregans]MBB5057003.1 glutathione peroxidase [Granulicella aggregans]